MYRGSAIIVYKNTILCCWNLHCMW